MNTLRNPVIAVMIVVGVLLAIGAPVVLIRNGAFAPQAETNLLQNGGFEGGFTVLGNRLTVPNGWKAAWSTGAPIIEGGSAGPCVMPEYKPMCDYDYRRTEGQCSACFFAFYSMTDGVLYQTADVPDGATVQARASVQAWASPNDATDPTKVPPSPGELYVSVGIDPDGQTDFRRHGVIWSPWVLVREQFVEVHSPVVQVSGSRATVYLRAATKWAQKHGDVYWDAAGLYVVQAGQATPVPTYTLYPTLQPLPTYTLYPTPLPCPTCAPGGECNCLTLEQFRSEVQRWQFVIR